MDSNSVRIKYFEDMIKLNNNRIELNKNDIVCKEGLKLFLDNSKHTEEIKNIDNQIKILNKENNVLTTNIEDANHIIVALKTPKTDGRRRSKRRQSKRRRSKRY